MKLPRRARAAALADRLVWQCASLLLGYPDQQRLNTAAALLDHVEGLAAKHLSQTMVAVRDLDPMRAAQEYVATFDLRRRCTMYLTLSRMVASPASCCPPKACHGWVPSADNATST